MPSERIFEEIRAGFFAISQSASSLNYWLHVGSADKLIHSLLGLCLDYFPVPKCHFFYKQNLVALQSTALYISARFEEARILDVEKAPIRL